MTLKRVLFVVLALALGLSFTTTNLAAQSITTGAIVGTVTDPSGAVVPNATVDLKDNVKGATQSTKTNASGVYQFSLLIPSNYSITVTASGFQTTNTVADVSLGAPTNISIALKVSSGGTTVTVTEVAPLTQTDNGDTSTSLTQQQVSQVPNPGNDLSFVAQLAPGVVVNTQGGFGNVEAFGLPATSNLFTLDGMDDNDPFLNLNNSGATNLLLGSNEVQEADVVTNGYSGSFGTFAGVNVNYVTKSGGNAFHGNAIYFWNGSALNANDWFNNAQGRDANGNPNSPKPFSNANQWAGSIGGPIKKDKLFFFFNTEGLRVLIPVPATILVPTAAFEASTVANLAASGLTASIPFYCQNLPACPGVGPVPGSGNGIFNFYNGVKNLANAVNIGSVDGGCSDLYVPTTPGGPGTFVGAGQTVPFGSSNPCAATLRVTPINFAPEKQLAGRGDWIIGPNDRAFMRMQYDQGVQPTNTDPINSLFNTQSNQPEYQGQLSETHSFGPTMVNQFLLAATWYSAIFKAANQAATLAAFPTTLQLNDGSLSNIGGINYAFPQGRNVTQYQVQDDVSKTWGNHTFKFGMKYHKNYVSDHDGGAFTSGLALPLSLGALYGGGLSPTSGAPTVLLQNFANAGTDLPIRLYEVAAYVQDEWRIKPNFTFTASLRAEHASNPVCLTNCFSQLNGGNFAAAIANQGLPYNQVLDSGRRTALNGYTTIQWEPRVSFAWQPFGTATGMLKSNVVVRGGVGIFYDIFPGAVADNISQNPPLYNPFTAVGAVLSPTEAGNVFAQAAASNTTFLNVFATGGGLAQLTALGGGAPNLTFTSAQTKAPQFQKWSLEVQKGFGPNTSVNIGYYGNHGIHIPLFNNSLNAFQGGNVLIASLPTAAPTAQFGSITQIVSAGVSNYNGVTASFQHRFTGFGSGIMQVNYTYSHALDNVSNGGFFNFSNRGIQNPSDPNNFKGNYGNADYDVRHYLNANYVWEVPVKTMLRGHGSDFFTKGWQLSGALFSRTPLPYSAVDGSITGSNNYNATVFPLIAGALPNGRSCNSEKFDGPAAIGNGCLLPANFIGVINAAGQVQGGLETVFGSGLRNFFRGSSYFDTDFTVQKLTKIPGWERGSFGMGLQFFNVFNHPNFNLPHDSVTDPLFGTSQSTVNPPTSILGSFLGGDASPRLIQLKLSLTF